MKFFLTDWYKKLDHYLLVNHTALWSTRFHWSVLWGSIGVGIIALLAKLIGNTNYIFELVVSFIAVIALILWLKKLFQFNYFKQHGKLSLLYYPLQFLSYFATVSILILWVYTPSYINATRVSEKEMIRDLNRMNVLYCELEQQYLPKEWKLKMKYLVNRYDRDAYKRNDRDNYKRNERVVNSGGIHKPDTAIYYVKEMPHIRSDHNYEDSLLRENDSTYYLFSGSVYLPYDIPNSMNDTNANVNARSLYNNYVLKKTDERELESKWEEIQSLISKYLKLGRINDIDSYSDDNSSTDLYRRSAARMRNIYLSNNVNYNVRNYYMERSRFFEGFWTWGIYVCYFICMVVSLSVFIFRHCNRKIFFWTWIGYAILSFFTVILNIIIGITSRHSDSFVVTYTIYFFIFLIFAVTLFAKRKSDIISLLSLNYFTYLLPSFPLYVLYIFPARHSDRYSYREEYLSDVQFYTFSGFFLLLALLPIFIGPLYKRAFSMPDK